MAFKQPDEQVIRALSLLQNSAEWMIVENWLSSCLTQQDADNRITSDETLYRGQGMAQWMSFFLTTCQQSREVLKKIRIRPERKKTDQNISRFP